jgi:hypothetical protein
VTKQKDVLQNAKLAEKQKITYILKRIPITQKHPTTKRKRKKLQCFKKPVSTTKTANKTQMHKKN